MLPRHFEQKLTADDEINSLSGNHTALLDISKKWWIKPQTTYVPQDLIDLNKEDLSHYVSLSNSNCVFVLIYHSIFRSQ